MGKAWRVVPSNAAYPKMMKKIGIWVEDTKFNRRAAAYARQTMTMKFTREFTIRKKWSSVVIGEKKWLSERH
jgi:hypothetical protein